MEHTNEFLQGMFAAYMGCDVKSKISGKVYSVVGISFENNCLIQCRINDIVHLYPKGLKPILTPLSKITDEDAVEVGRVMGFIDEECPIEDLKYWGDYTKKSYLCKFLFIKDRSQQVIEYLRSKHYDCGYMHIPSLIEAGLAVKATK